MLGFKKKAKPAPIAADKVVETIEEDTKAPTANTSITLTSGAEPVIWNLKDEPSKSLLDGDKSKIVRSVISHVAQHSEEFEYVAFDLQHKLTEDAPANRLALTDDEAWDLIAALASEQTHRKETGKTGKKIIVIINDGNSMISTRPKSEKSFDFLPKRQALTSDGAGDIYILSI